MEVLDYRRHGQHDGRLDLEDVLSDVLEPAAESYGRTAVHAGEEGRRALVAVMHREHREAYVLRTGLEHRLHQHGVEHEIAVAEHDALRDACRTTREDDRCEVCVHHLGFRIAAVSVPEHVAAVFAEFDPRQQSVLLVLVFLHVGVDDVSEACPAVRFDVLEYLVVLVVYRDDGFDVALDGQLLELALIELPVERDHYSDSADDREIGLAPLRGVPADEADVSFFETELDEGCSDRVYVLAGLAEADLSERLVRLVLLHEEGQIRVLFGAVVQHVPEICHHVLVLEEVALVLRLLELFEHLADDFALAPLYVSVF